MIKAYEWHPLTQYVQKVKNKYTEFVNKYNLIFTFDFKEWLQVLSTYSFNHLGPNSQENIEIQNLLKIFEPLDITCFKEFALFKYKNYIELNEMGYGSDFFDLYNGLYLECRSIVFDLRDCSIALASLAKFKNYGEDEKKWSASNIEKAYKETKIVNITNKLDGSYQQFSFHKFDGIIGSGSSALNVQESWRLKKGFEFLTSAYKKMIEDYPEHTFIFEFICVENPIVVKYTKEEEGLYLLAIRNKKNGKEMPFSAVKEIGQSYGVKITIDYQDENLRSILNQTSNYSSDEKEGWVIAMVDTDGVIFRAKIKTDDYVLMHKSLSQNISPNAIIQSILEGKLDDFKAKVPIAYIELVEKIEGEVKEYLRLISEYVELNYIKVLIHCNPEDKKEVMLYIQKEIPSFIQYYIINKYLGRPNNYLKKAINSHKKLGEILELGEKIKKEGF